jgi:NAD dependent epimerase/dehydratase family enzyme
MGPMANETILSSIHALPTKLISSAYPFRYRSLEDALNQALAAEKAEV